MRAGSAHIDGVRAHWSRAHWCRGRDSSSFAPTGAQVVVGNRPFWSFRTDAGEVTESFSVDFLLFHFRKLLVLANCFFADRILSEYGVCGRFERRLLWNGFIYTGFCFCFMNMIFSDRSDFTFCAKLPSDEEFHPPYVLSWMQACAS